MAEDSLSYSIFNLIFPQPYPSAVSCLNIIRMIYLPGVAIIGKINELSVNILQLTDMFVKCVSGGIMSLSKHMCCIKLINAIMCLGNP